MASTAPIMGAPAGAPPSHDALSQFETAHGDIDGLGAVLRAISDSVGPDGISFDGQRLIGVAIFVQEAIERRMSDAIAQGYAERRVN